MKNPTPVHQLPSFLASVEASKKQGPVKWLLYIIIGSLVLASLYIAYKLQKPPVLNVKPNSNETDYEQ